jgi:NAD(P)-dependent dehydrogenase (short-subunit alcohol dehydrogenase family)
MPHALITGGSKRIGAKITEHLHKSGWQATIHCRKLESDAANLIQADLNSPEEIKEMLAKIPTPDLVINNAAIFEADAVPHSHERHMQINYQAPVQIIEHYAQTASKEICIINLLDAWASIATPKMFGNYIKSKRALAQYTQASKLDLPANIRVNAIELGMVLYKEGQPKEIFLDLQKKFPTTLDDILQVIDYLVKDRSLRGEIINIPQWKLAHSAN